jgi:hypothetical protein
MSTTEINETFKLDLLPPDDLKVQRLGLLAEGFGSLAHLVNAQLPDGREKSIVLTKLQESYLFAIKAT